MNAQELAQKFTAKVAAAAAERDHQVTVAADNKQKRSDDVEHCKRAMELLLIDLDLSVVISPNWKTFGDFRA